MKRFVWVLVALIMSSFIAAASPPAIKTQPQSPTVLVGQPAVFGVEVADPDGISYQWRRNGVDIPDATSPAFILTNAQRADSSASFDVRVTNDRGTATSCRAVLTVIESGEPSTGPPVCEAPIAAGGGNGGGGCGGGGDGSGESSSSSSSSSSGGPGDLPNALDEDHDKPYAVTKWKGTVKATTVMAYADTGYTQVVEGEVTFESLAGEVGLFPRDIASIEGSITLTRDGTSGDCGDSVRASGVIGPNDGFIHFTPDPEPPQHATQLKYDGSGGSRVDGTQTRTCPNAAAKTNAWVEIPAWFLAIGATTSPDLLVISGTHTADSGPGAKTTYEWSLSKQR